MSGRRRTSGTRRALAACTAAVLVVVAASSMAQVEAAPGQVEPNPLGPVQLPEPSFALVERPAWIRPDGVEAFSVALAGDLEDATVRIELRDDLDSVEELRTSLDEDVGVRIFRSPPLPVDQLAPGADGTRVIAVKTSTGPSDEFTARISDPGVYPLVLTLADADGEVVDEIRTPVLRLGDDDDPLAAPTLSVLLDVDAPPTLRPDGTRSLSPLRLARLSTVGALLAEHPGLDLTVAATPDTVDALGASDDPAAAQLLERLGGSEALALPYLPMAVQSLRETELVGLLPPLVERGATVLADRLGARLRTGVWDPPADLDRRGAELLAELGNRTLLVPAPPQDDRDDAQALVPAGPVPLEDMGPLAGLVVDTGLSRDLSAPLPEGPDAAHVALAELLLRDAGEETAVLVRPRALPEDSVLAGLLDLLDTVDAPVRVGGLGVLPASPDPETDVVEWDGRRPPDLSDIAPRILADAARLDTFASMIDPRSARADELRLQIATAVAATTSNRRREQAVSAVERTLDEVFRSIRLAGETDLNLTSRQGTLPVTVQNDNPFPVDVLIRVRSDRLAFPEGDVLGVTVPGEGTRVDVPVEALATGSVPVFVELWTGNDQVKLDARQLNVRSTAISGVGVALSLGALLVLVVWWFRSWRRSRAGRRATQDASPR